MTRSILFIDKIYKKKNIENIIRQYIRVNDSDYYKKIKISYPIISNNTEAQTDTLCKNNIFMYSHVLYKVESPILMIKNITYRH